MNIEYMQITAASAQNAASIWASIEDNTHGISGSTITEVGEFNSFEVKFNTGLTKYVLAIPHKDNVYVGQGSVAPVLEAGRELLSSETPSVGEDLLVNLDGYEGDELDGEEYFNISGTKQNGETIEDVQVSVASPNTVNDLLEAIETAMVGGAAIITDGVISWTGLGGASSAEIVIELVDDDEPGVTTFSFPTFTETTAGEDGDDIGNIWWIIASEHPFIF